jgi:MoaA/NifB/PqqE/SkfB family radical SAM enzyme
MKKSFCAVPWTDLSVLPTGHYSMCCSQNQQYHLNKIPISQPADLHWNSDFMRQSRLLFADGIMPDTCQSCVRNESVGITSRRHRMNQRYLGSEDPSFDDEKVQQLLSKTSEDGSFSMDIVGVEIGGDNTCQLRCIQCSPSYSKSINKDYEKLGWDYNKKNRLPIEVRTETSLDQLFENLKPLVPKLQWLKFVGGEPSINKPLANFIDWCIENNHAQNIFLLCTTNAANVKDPWIEKISHFKKILLGISVDGIGALDEWIRWPTNWKKKEQNIKKLMNRFPDAYIHSTLFSLNIHKLDKLVQWCRNNNYHRLMIERLNWPDELSIKHLPEDVKQDLTTKLTKLANELTNDDWPNERRIIRIDDFLQRTVRFMNDNSQDIDMWDKCLEVVSSYNSIRQHTLSESNEFWQKYD